MSFKLVGDQFSQINATQMLTITMPESLGGLQSLQNEKRRRSDLLIQSIPDDEAYLMKNGRYACTVCVHRPVFDTIEMLSVHRHGQKHAAAAVKRSEEQAAFQLEVMKREQSHNLAEVKASSATSSSSSSATCQESPPLVVAAREGVKKALSKWSAPYNSRAIHHRATGGSSLPATFSATAGERLAPGGVTDSGKGTQKSSGDKAESKPQPEYVFPARAGQAKKRKVPTPKDAMAKSSKAASGNPEAARKAERVKRLLESGWVLLNDGSWARDPSAEFDSDEEPPSPL